MNIGIDHGYSAIKTRHFSFPAGISLYSSEPYTLQNTLEFEGKFHVCGTGRQPILRDKTENDNYYVPIRNKLHEGEIELVVFADDAAKVQRVLDNLNLDFVRAQAGEAVVETVPTQETQVSKAQTPDRAESVQLDGDTVQFEIGGAEDEFNLGESSQQDTAENFTVDREPESGEAMEKNPSAPSSNSRNGSPGSENSDRPSVKEELREIRHEQEKKRAEHFGTRERHIPKHYRTKDR